MRTHTLLWEHKVHHSHCSLLRAPGVACIFFSLASQLAVRLCNGVQNRKKENLGQLRHRWCKECGNSEDGGLPPLSFPPHITRPHPHVPFRPPSYTILVYMAMLCFTLSSPPFPHTRFPSSPPLLYLLYMAILCFLSLSLSICFFISLFIFFLFSCP